MGPERTARKRRWSEEAAADDDEAAGGVGVGEVVTVDGNVGRIGCLHDAWPFLAVSGGLNAKGRKLRSRCERLAALLRCLYDCGRLYDARRSFLISTPILPDWPKLVCQPFGLYFGVEAVLFVGVEFLETLRAP